MYKTFQEAVVKDLAEFGHVPTIGTPMFYDTVINRVNPSADLSSVLKPGNARRVCFLAI
jgi:hypothetical protein